MQSIAEIVEFGHLTGAHRGTGICVLAVAVPRNLVVSAFRYLSLSRSHDFAAASRKCAMASLSPVVVPVVHSRGLVHSA